MHYDITHLEKEILLLSYNSKIAKNVPLMGKANQITNYHPSLSYLSVLFVWLGSHQTLLLPSGIQTTMTEYKAYLPYGLAFTCLDFLVSEGKLL